MVAFVEPGYPRRMLRILTLCLASSLLFVVACGGDTGASDTGASDTGASDTGARDTGAPGIDAPSSGPDAPGDRPDVPGLDAPLFADDAFSTDDAPAVVTDDAPAPARDAPATADDAPRPAEDAFSNADAPASGTFCGGIAGIVCRSRADYCNYDCTIPDGAGTCEARPDVCSREVDPVCGCDGMTYTNPCQAAAAGQPVRSRGACPGGADCRTEGGPWPGQGGGTGGRSAGPGYDPRGLGCCMGDRSGSPPRSSSLSPRVMARRRRSVRTSATGVTRSSIR